MPNEVMLETSLLLHRDSANYLLALVRTTGTLEAVVSERLLEVASSEPNVLIRLAPVLEISREATVDAAVLRQLAQEMRQAVQTYRIPENPNTWYDGGSRPFTDALEEFTQDSLLTQILYEEWYFMVTESWLFSKTRRAFDAMVHAGGTAIQLSQRSFDLLVRRTLKKAPNEPLTPSNRVKAAAKWIAVGGPAILSAIEPVSAAIASATSGYFLLVDP
jgi:hypothetical protein